MELIEAIAEAGSFADPKLDPFFDGGFSRFSDDTSTMRDPGCVQIRAR